MCRKDSDGEHHESDAHDQNQNSENLADKMEQAIYEREKLVEFGKAGKQLVEKKYTYDYLLNLYRNAFAELAK